MGISKTEINLRRLIAAAPRQQNQAKQIHYVAMLRKLLEQLTEETTPEGLPRVSKAKVSDYSEKIESIASKLVSTEEIFVETSTEASPQRIEEVKVASPPGLRKRPMPSSYVEDKSRDNVGTNSSPLVHLDAAAHSHIDKHRKLQEDLTDEMVGMAQHLKHSSLLMSQSLQNAEKDNFIADKFKLRSRFRQFISVVEELWWAIFNQVMFICPTLLIGYS